MNTKISIKIKNEFQWINNCTDSWENEWNLNKWMENVKCPSNPLNERMNAVKQLSKNLTQEQVIK